MDEGQGGIPPPAAAGGAGCCRCVPCCREYAGRVQRTATARRYEIVELAV